MVDYGLENGDLEVEKRLRFSYKYKNWQYALILLARLVFIKMMSMLLIQNYSKKLQQSIIKFFTTRIGAYCP